MDRESLARFESKYVVAPEPHPVLGTPCWLWTGTTAQGYGAFYAPGSKSRNSHRLMWEHVNGPVPDGLELDHLCRIRNCVCPDHLEAVTHLENVRRGKVGSKTHCPQGHPYTDKAYVVKDPRGYHRRCNVCHAARAKAARDKKRAARRAPETGLS